MIVWATFIIGKEFSFFFLNSEINKMECQCKTILLVRKYTWCVPSLCMRPQNRQHSNDVQVHKAMPWFVTRLISVVFFSLCRFVSFRLPFCVFLCRKCNTYFNCPFLAMDKYHIWWCLVYVCVWVCVPRAVATTRELIHDSRNKSAFGLSHDLFSHTFYTLFLFCTHFLPLI